MTLTASNLTSTGVQSYIVSSSNTEITGAPTLALNASNMTLTASNLTSTGVQSYIVSSSNTEITGAPTLALNASNMTLTASNLTSTGVQSYTVTSSNVQVSACNSATFYAPAVNVSASNTFTLSASNASNVVINGFSVSASNLATSATNTTIDSTALSTLSGCNITIDALKTMYLESTTFSNVVSDNSVTSACNLYLVSSNTFLTSLAYSNTVTNTLFESAATITQRATGNFGVSAATAGIYTSGDTLLAVHNSNAYVRLNAATDSVDISATSNINLTPTGAFVATAGTTVNLTSTGATTINSSNTISMTAVNNNINLTGAALVTNFNDLDFAASNNIDFIIHASGPDPVVSIGSNVLQVNGNLLITGEISTSNIVNTTVVQKTLKVSDKIIKLANVGTGSNEVGPDDGLSTNHHSGLFIDGYPSELTSTSNLSMSNVYQKSILWNFGDGGAPLGTMGLGTSNLDKEAYWNVEGGSLRLTHKKFTDSSSNAYKEVAFGFRINESDELEIVKKFWSAGQSAYVYKRVARFGKLLS
jgi:hypothetical protein